MRDLHVLKCVYIGLMLATPELIRETGQLSRLAELIPRWREVPLYRDSLAINFPRTISAPASSNCLLLQKREMRTDFPRNFLPAGPTLESLLEKHLVELEHTSGTSAERLPVIFRARLVERAGGTRAAAERFCRKSSG